jgi:hypothetical protein
VDALDAAAIWPLLCLENGFPVCRYKEKAIYQSIESDETTLVYAPSLTRKALSALSRIETPNLIVYSFHPEHVTEILEGRAVRSEDIRAYLEEVFS